MRQIVLDTETTGINTSDGHRIIEIGCVEMVKRRPTGNHYHRYLQPDREIDQGAIEVHGITNEFLKNKPRFGDIADEFMQFIEGAELVIHNAPFDVGFIDHELELWNAFQPSSWSCVEQHCKVLDTLLLAREMHPGKRNSLDALCKRYDIDNTQRTLHGALLDAQILADVYLAMTGGQSSLVLGEVSVHDSAGFKAMDAQQIQAIPVLKASDEDMQLHQALLDKIRKEGACVWDELAQTAEVAQSSEAMD